MIPFQKHHAPLSATYDASVRQSHIHYGTRKETLNYSACLHKYVRTAKHWMPLCTTFVTTRGRYFCKSQLNTNVNRSGKKTFHSSRRSFNGYTLSPCRHTFSVQGTKRPSKQGCQNCTHSVSLQSIVHPTH